MSEHEKPKSPVIARRAVFAGLGLLGTLIVNGITINPIPAKGLTALDTWITDLDDGNGRSRQISSHYVTRGGGRTFNVTCLTTIYNYSYNYVQWSTTKTFMATRDDGSAAQQVAYIGPDWRTVGRGGSMSQQAGFSLGTGGIYKIVGEEHDFREGTYLTASWRFELSIPFIITAIAGAGGSITSPGETYVDPHSSKGYTCSAENGYIINEVKVDGVSIGKPNSYTFNQIYGDHRIEVSFVPAGRAHFMMVDSDGDITEVYVTDQLVNTTITAGDTYFVTAEKAISDIFAKDGFSVPASSLDAWYPGGKNYDEGILKGPKFSSQLVKGDIYIWAFIWAGRVRFLADGANDVTNLVYKSPLIPFGNTYYFPTEATQSAIKPYCNLNAHHGEAGSTGFTGWFNNKELSGSHILSVQINKSSINVYGRNRLSVRFEYAEDTERRAGDSGDYRVEPDDNAAVYKNPFALPDFSGNEPVHQGWNAEGTQKYTLPAIGDNADNHRAIYRGERIGQKLPDPVYERLSDGRWRCFVADGWYTKAKASSTVTSWIPEADETRQIRWHERKVEGTEAFIPGYDPSYWE